MACYQKFHKKKVSLVICRQCHKIIKRNLSDIKRGRVKFCGQVCAKKFMIFSNHPSWKGRFEKECLICKKIMVLPRIRSRQRVTCSKDCYKIHLSKKLSGNYTHLWKNGKSREPYPITFNGFLKNKIRNRDKNTCQVCGVLEKMTRRKLDVHHVDYDKDNLNDKNLISLCRSCHRKTNFNRNFWEKKFKGMLK